MKKIAVIGILLLAGLAFLIFRNKPQKTQAEMVAVAVAKGDIKNSIQSTGTVQPQNRLVIKPPISGRMEEILVKEGQYVRRGQILAWMSSEERAALLDVARAKGEAELKRWKDLYKAAPLVAPLNGQIIARNVEPGQSFTSADGVFVMSDRLIILAQVDETDIGKIKVGQEVSANLDAYPDEEIDAVVDQIAFEAKTVSNVTVYQVDVLPRKVPEMMRSGMTANVEFMIDFSEDVLLVPEEAVKHDGSGTYVTRKDPKSGRGLTVTVETGLDDGKNMEVLSGLNEGDLVLVPAGPQFSATAKQAASNPFMPKPPSPGRGGGRH
jgi:macrolide-specific efflux system membrane fusion protein